MKALNDQNARRDLGAKPSLIREAAAAKVFASAQHAPATRRAYRADWVEFEAWSASRNVAALPSTPELVAAFIGFEATRGLKASSVSRRVAAIRYVHRAAGFESPTRSEIVSATLRGIRRELSMRPEQKAAATRERLFKILAHVPQTTQGARDRALLLLGFAAALRRNELVAIDVEDLEFLDEGARVHVRRAKTDQERHGATVTVIRGRRACPVAAVEHWLRVARITKGPVFRRVLRNGRVGNDRLSDKSVALIIKRYALKCGLDPALYAGHSLRAGFATSASAAGATAFGIMAVTRHKKTDTLREYVRPADAFKDHAGEGLL